MTAAARRRWFLPWLVILVVVTAGSALAIVFGFSGRREWQAKLDGKEAYGRKDYAATAEWARGQLKRAPEDREALRMLARASARLGRHETANALFSRVGSAELQAEDLYLLGVGLDRAGQKDSAHMVWKKAVSLEPNHAESLKQLITKDLEQSRIAEAAEHAAQLAKVPGWELRGELELGALRAEVSDPAGSADVLRRALGRPEAAGLEPPAMAYYRKLLARNLLKTGHPAEARSMLGFIGAERADSEMSWLLSRAALQEGAIAVARDAARESSSYRAEHPLEAEPSPFVGAARCTSCHQEQAHALQGSRHATTLLRGAEIGKLPYPDRPIADPDNASVTHSFIHEKDEKIRAETKLNGRVLEAVVEYAFGAPDRYVSLVGNDRDGQAYILRMSHYQSGGQSGWVRTTGHSADAEGETNYLGKPLDRTSGIHACLFCHATDPKAVLDKKGPVAEDHAIGCERCHGPGGNHLSAVAAKLDDLAIINPSHAPAERQIRVCGQCHSQHQPSSLPRSDPYWLRFQGTTLTWSRCFTESGGALDCSSCHNPHGEATPTPARQDARCLECHSASSSATSRVVARAARPVGEVASRGAICKVNASSGCVGCHMPSTEIKALRAKFTDHYIRVHDPSKPASAK